MSKTYYDYISIFSDVDCLKYCEDRGIYEPYSRCGKILTYYIFYSSEGFYKVKVNVRLKKEIFRKHMKSYTINKLPDHLWSKAGWKYNYFI